MIALGATIGAALAVLALGPIAFLLGSASLHHPHFTLISGPAGAYKIDLRTGETWQLYLDGTERRVTLTPARP